MKIVVALVALIFTLAGSALTKMVFVHDGFVKGESFVSMSGASQTSYAAGLIDGMLLAPLFGAPQLKQQWLIKCIQQMSDVQVTAVLAKRFSDNPSASQQYANLEMFAALRESCPKQK